MASRRDIIRNGLGTAASLVMAGPLQAMAASPNDAILADVHPELRGLAKMILDMGGSLPVWKRADLPAIRQGSDAFQPKPLADIPHERRVISGSRGQPDVTVYLVNAQEGAHRPCILHLHGGGYVAGSAAGSINQAQTLARALDCVVVTVEYRLAPETTYTGSLEDNYAALKWTHTNSASLGIDPARIAVMGESAGGGHAVLLAIAARDRGEVPVCFQSLVYPMLDDRTGSTRQAPAHRGQILWTAQANRFGWECFLSRKPGGRSGEGVPGRTANLAGLPPAWIGVGALDLFLDEDMDYARRLNAADVAAELLVIPGAFHGFDAFGSPTGVGQRFSEAKLNALRQAFKLPAA